MAKGNPGADSSSPVTDSLISTATQQFGQAPKFWGRYFTSPTTSGEVEYRHGSESPVLASHNIRLLPVARQTTRVAGSEQEGVSDAEANVSDFLDTFGQSYLASQGGQFLLFLDVEGNPSVGSPSLSLDYYLGWAKTLVSYSQSQTGNAVTILPCVYGTHFDTQTWENVVAANAQGATCHGAWIARYYYSGCEQPDWNDSVIMPTVSLPCEVLLWQYQEDCCGGAIDCNQTNPSVDTQTLLLDKLLLPPAS